MSESPVNNILSGLTVNPEDGIRLSATTPYFLDEINRAPTPYGNSELDDLFANGFFYDGFHYTIPTVLEALTNAKLGFTLHQAKLFHMAVERDPTIAAHLGTRIRAVLGIDWDIKVEDGASPAGAGKARALRKSLKKAGLRELIRNLCSANVYGYDLNVINWDEGGKDVRSFTHVDHGNVYFDIAGRVEARGLTSMVREIITPQNAAKFVIHKCMLLPGIPSTGGFMRNIIFYYLFKHEIMKHMVRYSEKFGMPQIVAKLTEVDFNNPNKRAFIKEMLQKLGSDGVLLTNQQTSVEPFEPKSSTSNGDYQSKLEYYDRCIAQLILGQTATSSDKGGMSKGDSQAAVRQDILESDCAELVDTIDNQIRRPFEKFRYGEDSDECSFTMAYKQPEDIAMLSKVYVEMSPVIQGLGKRYNAQKVAELFNMTLEDVPEVATPAMPDLSALGLGGGQQPMATSASPVAQAPVPAGGISNEDALASAVSSAPITPEAQAVGGAAPASPFPQAEGSASPIGAMSDNVKLGYIAFADLDGDGLPDETDEYGNPTTPDSPLYDPNQALAAARTQAGYISEDELGDVIRPNVANIFQRTPELQEAVTSYSNPRQMIESGRSVIQSNLDSPDIDEEDRKYFQEAQKQIDDIDEQTKDIPISNRQPDSALEKYAKENKFLSNRLSSEASAVNYRGGHEQMKQEDPEKRKEFLSSIFDSQMKKSDPEYLKALKPEDVQAKKVAFISEAERRRGMENDKLADEIKGWSLGVSDSEKTLAANGTAGILWEASKRGNEDLIMNTFSGLNAVASKLSLGAIPEADVTKKFRQYKKQEEVVDSLMGSGTIMDAAVMVSGMIVPVIGAIGLAPFTGGASAIAGSAAVFGAAGLGSTYNELKDEGVSDNIAFAAGMGVGAIDGILSSMQLGKFAPVLTAPIGKLTKEARTLIGSAIVNAYKRTIDETGEALLSKALAGVGNVASHGGSALPWALAPMENFGEYLAKAGVKVESSNAIERLLFSSPYGRSIANFINKEHGALSTSVRGVSRFLASSFDAGTLGAWQMFAGNLMNDGAKIANDVIEGSNLGDDINVKQQARDAFMSVFTNLPAMIGMTALGHVGSWGVTPLYRNSKVVKEAQQQEQDAAKIKEVLKDAVPQDIKDKSVTGTTWSTDEAVKILSQSIKPNDALGFALKNKMLDVKIVDDPNGQAASFTPNGEKRGTITFNFAKLEQALKVARAAKEASGAAWTHGDSIETVAGFMKPLVAHEGYGHYFLYNSGLSKKDLGTIESLAKTIPADSYNFGADKVNSYYKYYMEGHGVPASEVPRIIDLINANDSVAVDRAISKYGLNSNKLQALVNEERVAHFLAANWQDIVVNKGGKFTVLKGLVKKMQSKFLEKYASAIETVSKFIDPKGEYKATELRREAALKLIGYTLRNFYDPTATIAAAGQQTAETAKPAMERLSPQEEAIVKNEFIKDQINDLRTNSTELGWTDNMRILRDAFKTISGVELPDGALSEIRPEMGGVGKSLDAIARAFGQDVIFYGAKNASGFPANFLPPNGVRVGGDRGRIYIKANASMPHLQIFGHELTHEIEKSHPELYLPFMNAIMEDAKEFGKWKSWLTSNYEKQGVKGQPSYVTNELAAEYIGEKFMDTAFWDRVGQKNPNLLKAIGDTLNNLINKVKVAFNRPGLGTISQQVVNDTNKLQEIAAHMIRKYADIQSGAKTSDVYAIYDAMMKNAGMSEPQRQSILFRLKNIDPNDSVSMGTIDAELKPYNLSRTMLEQAIKKPSIGEQTEPVVSPTQKAQDSTKVIWNILDTASKSASKGKGVQPIIDDMTQKLVNAGVNSMELGAIVEQFRNRFGDIKADTETSTFLTAKKGFDNWVERQFPKLRYLTEREVDRIVNIEKKKLAAKMGKEAQVDKRDYAQTFKDVQAAAIDYANELFATSPEDLAKAIKAINSIEPPKMKMSTEDMGNLIFTKAIEKIDNLQDMINARADRKLQGAMKIIYGDNPLSDVGRNSEVMQTFVNGLADVVDQLTDGNQKFRELYDQIEKIDATPLDIKSQETVLQDIGKLNGMSDTLLKFVKKGVKLKAYSEGLNRDKVERLVMSIEKMASEDKGNSAKVIRAVSESIDNINKIGEKLKFEASLDLCKSLYTKLESEAGKIKKPSLRSLAGEEIFQQYGEANRMVLELLSKYTTTKGKESPMMELVDIISGKEVALAAINQLESNTDSAQQIIKKFITGRLGVKGNDGIEFTANSTPESILDSIKAKYGVDANVSGVDIGSISDPKVRARYEYLKRVQDNSERVRNEIAKLEARRQALSQQDGSSDTTLGRQTENGDNEIADITNRIYDLRNQLDLFTQNTLDATSSISSLRQFIMDASAAYSGVKNFRTVLDMQSAINSSERAMKVADSIKAAGKGSSKDFANGPHALTFIDKILNWGDDLIADHINFKSMIGFFDAYSDNAFGCTKILGYPINDGYTKRETYRHSFGDVASNILLDIQKAYPGITMKGIGGNSESINIAKYKIPGLERYGKLPIDAAMKIYALSGDAKGIEVLLKTFRNVDDINWTPERSRPYVDAIVSELRNYKRTEGQEAGPYAMYVDRVKEELVKGRMWAANDSAYFKLHGRHLADIPDYWTIRGLVNTPDSFLLQDIMGRGTFGKNNYMKTISTSDRTSHVGELDMNRPQSFMGDLGALINETSEFAGLAVPLAEMGKLMYDKNFIEAVNGRGEFAQKMYKRLREWHKDALNPRPITWASQFSRTFASSLLLAFKPTVWLMQFTAIPVGLRDADPVELANTLVDKEMFKLCVNKNILYKQAPFLEQRERSGEPGWRTLAESPSFAKYNESDLFTQPLRKALYGSEWLTKQALADFGKFVTKPIQLIDQFCARISYAAQYKIGVNRALRLAGDTPLTESQMNIIKEDAHKRATDLTIQTQQMSDPLFAASIFRATGVQGSMMRMFTLFMTPLSQMNNAAFVDMYRLYKAKTGVQLSDMSDLVDRPLVESDLEKLGIRERLQLSTGIILTMAITPLITAMTQHGDVTPDPKDMAKAFIEQNFGGAVIVGQSAMIPLLELLIGVYGYGQGEGKKDINQQMQEIGGLSVPAYDLAASFMKDIIKSQVIGDPSDASYKDLANKFTFGLGNALPISMVDKFSAVRKYGFKSAIYSSTRIHEPVIHPVSMGLTENAGELDDLVMNFNAKYPGTSIRFPNPKNVWEAGVLSFGLSLQEYDDFWKLATNIFMSNPTIQAIANEKELTPAMADAISKAMNKSREMAKEYMIKNTDIIAKHRGDIYRAGYSSGDLPQALGMGYQPNEEQKDLDIAAFYNKEIAKYAAKTIPQEVKMSDIESLCDLMAFADARQISSLPKNVQGWLMAVAKLDEEMDVITAKLGVAKKQVSSVVAQGPVEIPQMNKTLVWNPPSKRLTLNKNKMLQAIMGNFKVANTVAAKVVSEGGNASVTSGFVKVSTTHRENKPKTPVAANPQATVQTATQPQQKPVAPNKEENLWG